MQCSLRKQESFWSVLNTTKHLSPGTTSLTYIFLEKRSIVFSFFLLFFLLDLLQETPRIRPKQVVDMPTVNLGINKDS